jgi:hypothetical protein
MIVAFEVIFPPGALRQSPRASVFLSCFIGVYQRCRIAKPFQEKNVTAARLEGRENSTFAMAGAPGGR